MKPSPETEYLAMVAGEYMPKDACYADGMCLVALTCDMLYVYKGLDTQEMALLFSIPVDSILSIQRERITRDAGGKVLSSRASGRCDLLQRIGGALSQGMEGWRYSRTNGWERDSIRLLRTHRSIFVPRVYYSTLFFVEYLHPGNGLERMYFKNARGNIPNLMYRFQCLKRGGKAPD